MSRAARAELTRPCLSPPSYARARGAQAEDARRREEEAARLEARRNAIRERIAKQHEIAARLAEERAKAEEAAKANIGKFVAAKPLYLKLQVRRHMWRRGDVAV